MTIHTFLNRRSRFANTLSVLLALLMLLPSLAGFAKPMQSAAASPSSDPVDRLKVGDVIWAKNNATGKAEWKQIIHSSKRTVPALLNVRLINAKTGKTAAELTCPLDEKVTLNNGKRIPAARLAVGNSIITRAGPVCRVTAMWLLKRPGGFVLSDVRVGPLSAAQVQRLAASQSTQARPPTGLNFAGYAAPASAGANTLNPFLFQGQQFDPFSGDYYLRARYYDPTMGRFLSQDPLEGNDNDPVSLHRYLYASADPVNRIDPGGKEDANFSLGGQTATEGIAAEENATLSPSIANSLVFANQSANSINVGNTIGLVASLAGATLLSGTDTRDREQRQVLFHYTDARAAAAILAEGAIIATPEFRPSLPSGAYASDISPVDPGRTQRELSRLFYGDNPTHDTSWYVMIDNTDSYLGGFRPLVYQGHPHFFIKDFPAGLPVPVKVLSIGPNPMPLGQ